MNGFTVLPGGNDAVIVSVILEHWFNVFRGREHWSDVLYFFPYTRTIAQTDAYFLVGLAYSPFRLLGLDPFISMEAASLVLKPIGFFSTLLLCQKRFAIPYRWGVLAAALFTLSNGMTSHIDRLQLASVAFAPVMVLLIWSALEAFISENKRQFVISAVSAAVLFGAWCMTCFYISWFFLFLSIAFFIVVSIFERSRLGLVGAKIKSQWALLLLAFGAAAASLTPFAYAFIPKAMEVGVRSWADVLPHTVPITGVLQVGEANLLFGRWYNHLIAAYLPASWRGQVYEYYNMGFTFALFFFFISGSLSAIIKWRQTGGFVLRSIAIATLITWLLIINFSGYSAWFVIYQLFPGARALQVVSTYQLLLALPVVVIAVKYLSAQRMSVPVAIFTVSILLVSELNRPYLALDRSAEMARFALSEAPPRQCQAFYVSGWKGQETMPGPMPDLHKRIYPHNIAAMFIAQMTGIPTINGMASFNPPDWDFANPNSADYEQRVQRYAERHQLKDLCRLDLNTKRWSLSSPTLERKVCNSSSCANRVLPQGTHDAALNIASGSNDAFLLDDHWAEAESWGRWTSATTATLTFFVGARRDVGIELVISPLLSTSAPRQSVWVKANGCEVGSIGFDFAQGAGTKIISGNIPSSCIGAEGKIVLRIETDRVRTPKELGINRDSRNLGVAVGRITVRN